jgi:hypothetical protein
MPVPVSALRAALGVCSLTIACWPATDPRRTVRRWRLASSCALAATGLLTWRIILGYLFTAARVASDTLANFGACADWGGEDPGGVCGPASLACLAYHARTYEAYHYLLPLAGATGALLALGIVLDVIARRSAKLEVSPYSVVAGLLRCQSTWAWLLAAGVAVLPFLS